MEDKPVTEKMQKAQMMLNELEIRQIKRQSATFVGADLDLLIMLLRRVLPLVFVFLWGNLQAQNRGNIGQPGPTLTPVGDSMGLSIPYGEIVHGTGTKLPGSSDSLIWNAGLSVTGRITLNSLLASPLDSLLYVDTLNRVGKIHKNDLGITGGDSAGVNVTLNQLMYGNGTKLPEFSDTFRLNTSPPAFVVDLGVQGEAVLQRDKLQLGVNRSDASNLKTSIEFYTSGVTQTGSITQGSGFHSEMLLTTINNEGIKFKTLNSDAAKIWPTHQWQFYDYTAVSSFPVTSVGMLTFDASGYIGTQAIPTTAGSTGEVQFNSAGAFGASSNLFWDNGNSRLGIGTAAPTQQFHSYKASGSNIGVIQSDTDFLSFFSNNTFGPAMYWLNTTALRFGTATGSDATGFSEKMRIASNGDVGIGTTSPATPLDVYSLAGTNVTLSRGNVGLNDAVDILTDANADGIRIISGTLYHVNNSAIQFWDNGSTFAGIYLDACSGCDIQLRDGSTTNIFVEGSNGNVGIGTSTPEFLVDVKGSGFFRGITTLSGTGLIISNNNTIGPWIASHTDEAGNSTANYAASRWNPQAAGQLFQTSPATSIGAARTFTTRMQVTSTGVAVGSGTIAASAVLDVQSTTQGLLLPRMTTTQRDAISSPAAGLIIYNTTTTKLEVYNGAWTAVH